MSLSGLEMVMERASVGRRAVLAGLAAGALAGCGRAGAGLGESYCRCRAVPLPRDGWDRHGARQFAGGSHSDGGVHPVSGAGAEPG